MRRLAYCWQLIGLGFISCEKQRGKEPDKLVLSIAPDNCQVTVGESIQLSLFANDSKVDVYKWQVEPSNVATVSDKGLVKGLSEGEAVVSAVYREQSVQKSFKVKPKAYETIEL